MPKWWKPPARIGVLAVLVAGLAGVLLVAVDRGTGGSPPRSLTKRSSVTQPRPSGTSPTTPGPPSVSVPASTVVADLRGSIPRFASPGGPETGTIPGAWYGSPSDLPVIANEPGWLEVRLAQRPDGSTAWVLAKDVAVSTTPYALVLNLSTRHLALYRRGKLVFSAPAGVGTARYPTPTGQYFVALFASPPSPGYGAFVMVTSAHSNAITDWDHSGDAIVAIHGPLGDGAEIGTTGAAISHGCIRLHESDLLRLRQVPTGTPVTIIS